MIASGAVAAHEAAAVAALALGTALVVPARRLALRQCRTHRLIAHEAGCMLTPYLGSRSRPAP